MSKEANKILLAGVGAAALSLEKASSVVSEWVKKGKMTVEDGKEFTEELKRNITEKSSETKDSVMEKVDNYMPVTKDGLKEILNEMNFATRSDILEIKRKVEALEGKLNELEDKTNKEVEEDN